MLGFCATKPKKSGSINRWRVSWVVLCVVFHLKGLMIQTKQGPLLKKYISSVSRHFIFLLLSFSRDHTASGSTMHPYIHVITDVINNSAV